MNIAAIMRRVKWLGRNAPATAKAANEAPKRFTGPNAEYLAQREAQRKEQAHMARLESCWKTIANLDLQFRHGEPPLIMILGWPGLNPFAANPDSFRDAIAMTFSDINESDRDELIKAAMLMVKGEIRNEAKRRRREARGDVYDESHRNWNY